ncbi:hypothetical protein niasHT_009907 [Heterodera trifolii]|uniref:Uncharacterized protein n=1 Tax=Heterodera trifolii TaxID=157864 RepID=A0ABD2MDV1_9BILA
MGNSPSTSSSSSFILEDYCYVLGRVFVPSALPCGDKRSFDMLAVGASALSTLVPLIDDKDKELKTIGKLFQVQSEACGGLSKVTENWTRWAVEVEYKCDQCGRVVHVTYGILPQGKFKRFGRMANTANSTVWMVNRAYPDIERVYDGMRSNYNFGTRDWAEEMIRRVLNQ